MWLLTKIHITVVHFHANKIHSGLRPTVREIDALFMCLYTFGYTTRT